MLAVLVPSRRLSVLARERAGRPGAAADPPAVPRPVPAGAGEPADLVAHHRGPLLRAGAGRRLARAAPSASGALVVPALGARGLVGAHGCPRRPRASLLPGRLDQFVLGAGVGVLSSTLASAGTVPTRRRLDGSGRPPRAAGRPRRHRHLPRGDLPVRRRGAPPAPRAPGRAGWLIAGLVVRLTCGPTPALLRAPAARVAGRHQLQPLPLALPDPRLGASRSSTAALPTGLVALVALSLVLVAGVASAAAPPTGGGARRPSPRARRRAYTVLEPELGLEDRQEVRGRRTSPGAPSARPRCR